jgi:hypothetical protein
MRRVMVSVLCGALGASIVPMASRAQNNSTSSAVTGEYGLKNRFAVQGERVGLYRAS